MVREKFVNVWERLTISIEVDTSCFVLCDTIVRNLFVTIMVFEKNSYFYDWT